MVPHRPSSLSGTSDQYECCIAADGEILSSLSPQGGIVEDTSRHPVGRRTQGLGVEDKATQSGNGPSGGATLVHAGDICLCPTYFTVVFDPQARGIMVDKFFLVV